MPQPNHTTPVNANGSNGAAAPLREKVQFRTNETEFLKLEFDPPAEPRAGRFGDQYMYFFDGNRIAWFDPPVHELILRSGAAAGDEIAVTKREVKEGRRMSVRWEVELVQEEPPYAGEPSAEVLEDVRRGRPVPRLENPKRQAEAPAPPAAPQTVPAPPPPAPALEGPRANPLAQALILALEAAEEANKYAQTKLAWDEFPLSEDAIVKLAVTAYIQAQGGRQARP